MLTSMGITHSPDFSLQTSKIMLTTYKKAFEDFRKRLEIIGSIEVGDKLSKDAFNNYYIDKTSNFQKFKRWWYSQNRIKTEKDLDDDFVKLSDFFDKILEGCQTYNKEYNSFLNKVMTFVTNIMVGLYNLKKTYPENEKIVVKIDSIILTLIDFEEEVHKKKQLPVVNNTTRRNSFDV